MSGLFNYFTINLDFYLASIPYSKDIFYACIPLFFLFANKIMEEKFRGLASYPLLRSTIAIPDIWWSTRRAFPPPIVWVRTPNGPSSFLSDLYLRLDRWRFWRTDRTNVVRTYVVRTSTTTKEGDRRGLGRNQRPIWPYRRRRSTWGGRDKSSRTAIRSESGEKKFELVLQILQFYFLIIQFYLLILQF